MKPFEIEQRSMEIILEELNGRTFPEPEFSVIKRCIHTSADFDYADNLKFSKDSVLRGIEAMKQGAQIITDTSMAAAGINKRVLGQFGGQVHCFIGEETVATEAKERGMTRSAVCMEQGAKLKSPLIFAIGNAPTALIRLCELIEEGNVLPNLVIGAPVGFVNVLESKERLLSMKNVSYIVADGRKGGSNIAAAICNAMIYKALEENGTIRE